MYEHPSSTALSTIEHSVCVSEMQIERGKKTWKKNQVSKELKPEKYIKQTRSIFNEIIYYHWDHPILWPWNIYIYINTRTQTKNAHKKTRRKTKKKQINCEQKPANRSNTTTKNYKYDLETKLKRINKRDEERKKNE